MKLEYFDRFQKNPKALHFMNIFPVCNELFSAEGQTERETLIVAFPDIGKAHCKWRQYKSVRKTHGLKEDYHRCNHTFSTNSQLKSKDRM